MGKTSKSFKLPRPQLYQNNSISYKVQNGSEHQQDFGDSKFQTGNGNELQALPELEERKDDQRGAWGSKMEFLMSCISMSVGLGNIWRFPNIAYQYGGGAFLIPYLILLVVIGRPLYYMELTLGQFSGSGPIKVWSCVPALKGIGYAQMVSTFYVMIFYNYLMALTIFYFFASMQNPLPWDNCEQNASWILNYNCSLNASSQLNTSDSLPEEYFNNFVLHKSSGLEELTSIDWRLVLCLLMAWICVFLAIMKGIESAGKVAYFTALFPYTILIALLVVSLLANGSTEGIEYFFKPQWEKLLDVKVWYKACEQSFFSLAVGYGALVMYSSYNKFDHNVNRDAIIISITDTATSILAGCVIFSVLGTLAVKKNMPVKDVVDAEGLGLAFIAYPEALAQVPFVPQLWAVLFFFMFFTLGIGSSVAQTETILTAVRDRYPNLRKQKWKLALGMCFLSFICGLPLTTNAGQHIMPIIDNYGVGTAVFFYGILEIIGIMWIYGYSNFSQDIHFMLGERPGIFWRVMWFAVTPIFLIVIFVYGNIDTEEKKIPSWGIAIGWVLAAMALVQIPIWGTWEYIKTRRDPVGLRRSVFSHTEKWGPRDPRIRLAWLQFKRVQGQSIPMEPPPPYSNYGFDSSLDGADGLSSPSTSWEEKTTTQQL